MRRERARKILCVINTSGERICSHFRSRSLPLSLSFLSYFSYFFFRLACYHQTPNVDLIWWFIHEWILNVQTGKMRGRKFLVEIYLNFSQRTSNWFLNDRNFWNWIFSTCFGEFLNSTSRWHGIRNVLQIKVIWIFDLEILFVLLTVVRFVEKFSMRKYIECFKLIRESFN